MMNMTKNIPLIIASGLSLLTLSGTFISNIFDSSGYTYLYETDIIIGAIALVLLWTSKLINKKIWIYLLLLTLIASFSNWVDFSNIKLSFSIGSLEINLIALTLTISHFVLNSDTFQIKEKTQEDITNEFETKVDYYINKFSSKSLDELKTRENNDLIPEAKEAIKRLINEKSV